MLLTHEANRFYASGFHSAGTDGMALVTREKFYYFTDSRYTEAARRHVQDAEVQEAGHGRGYSALLMEPSSATASSAWGLRTPIWPSGSTTPMPGLCL